MERCARLLRHAIVAGELPPGLRLPPERELATRFGVNRVTVRSALARMEAEHLVQPRQGSGYVVRDFRRNAGPDLIATLATLASSSADRVGIMRDLLVVRRHLAHATLERLVTAATDDDLARVDAAVDRFAERVAERAELAQLMEADLDVVAELVAASHSPVLQLCFNPVAALVRELPALQRAMYREPESNVLAFRAVVGAVRTRHPGLVAKIIEQLAQRDAATTEALAHPPRKHP